MRRTSQVRRAFYAKEQMTSPVPRLRFQLMAATFVRVVINTANRMVYPFLPEFSRGLGVPLETLAQMVSVRNALGMASPFFGVIPDRLGRPQAMLIGVAVFCGALTLVGLFPGEDTFFAALILVVVTKFIFDPALQAYLGDRTPYARRGAVIALTELGWSGAALIGIPLAGFLIQRSQNWRSPFLPLAGLGLIGGLALWLIIPRDAPGAAQAPATRPHWWTSVWGRPRVLAAMSIGLFASAANESLNVVYGSWMEQSFHLQVAQLGFSVTVIGIAELAGEGLVMILADRLGKRRAIAIGLAAGAGAYAVLPFLDAHLYLALAALFFVYLAFEFAVVAAIPFMTELVPEARGTVMSSSVAFYSAGRMLGALLGGYLFPFGFRLNGLAAAALNLVTLGLIFLFVRERP